MHRHLTFCEVQCHLLVYWYGSSANYANHTNTVACSTNIPTFASTTWCVTCIKTCIEKCSIDASLAKDMIWGLLDHVPGSEYTYTQQRVTKLDLMNILQQACQHWLYTMFANFITQCVMANERFHRLHICSQPKNYLLTHVLEAFAVYSMSFKHTRSSLNQTSMNVVSEYDSISCRIRQCCSVANIWSIFQTTATLIMSSFLLLHLLLVLLLWMHDQRSKFLSFEIRVSPKLWIVATIVNSLHCCDDMLLFKGESSERCVLMLLGCCCAWSSKSFTVQKSITTAFESL